MRCVAPSIEKKWKRSESAAFPEAKRQAEDYAREQLNLDRTEKPHVRFTGRTLHGPNDWVFEFALGGDASTETP